MLVAESGRLFDGKKSGTARFLIIFVLEILSLYYLLVQRQDYFFILKTDWSVVNVNA